MDVKPTKRKNKLENYLEYSILFPGQLFSCFSIKIRDVLYVVLKFDGSGLCFITEVINNAE